jgi:hypothetical protein
LEDHEFYIVHGDEAWKTLFSRRVSNKVLPLGEHEPEGANFTTTRRLVSRQHPAKVMVMAVVGKPDPIHNFNGKISLKRVSRKKRQINTSYNQDFCTSRSLLESIEDGDWHHLYQGDTPGYTMGDLAEDLRELYNLHGDHNLLFRYQNCIIVGGEQKKKWVNLSEWEVLENKLITTENNVDRQLTLADLHLYQKVVPGTLVEEDVSCNSEYMQEIIPIIGQEIREAYHWVPQDHPIYFQLDNAGGHGRKDVVEGYTALLRREFNIILRHQPARSPETNALDLGCWMALQNRTEKKSFDKRISNNNVFAAV